MTHIQCRTLKASDFDDQPTRTVCTELASNFRVIQTFGKYGRYHIEPCVEFPEGKYAANIKELRALLMNR